MTTYIRTALLSALVLSLACGFASATDVSVGARAAPPATLNVASRSHGGIQPPLMVKCRDPIECSKGRA